MNIKTMKCANMTSEKILAVLMVDPLDKLYF